MMTAAGGDAINIENIYSNYYYQGAAVNPPDIVNNIDLANEGGMVWVKSKFNSYSHGLFDTVRGVKKYISSDNTDSEQTWVTNYAFDSFTSTGVEAATNGNSIANISGRYASWTFRKCPSFFDIVTYTGTGTTNSISHNLGSTPGAIFIKNLTSAENWYVYHRSLGVNKYVRLNTTASAATDSTNMDSVTSSAFTVKGNGGMINESGRNYVAYVFAHNNGDGIFGPTGDQDVIKCGKYTGNGNSVGPEIDLGFEPQWLLIKDTTNGTQEWTMTDNMQGLRYDTGVELRASSNNRDFTSNSRLVRPLPDGFQPCTADESMNANSRQYIYIAIRRGPMATPESADDVMTTATGAGSGEPMFVSGFAPDFAFAALNYTSAHDNKMEARMFGKLYWNNESSSSFEDGNNEWYYPNGYRSQDSNQPSYISWMFKRAPGFCDVIQWDPNGTTGTVTIPHNLGVVPDAILETRVASSNKTFSFKDLAGSSSPSEWSQINLDGSNSKQNFGNALYSNVTSTSFDAYSTNDDKMYVLFAELDGISKIGTFTSSVTTGPKNIDCGFSNGIRWLLMKPTVSGYSWTLFDSVRGINAGNDPFIYFNTTQAEQTTQDVIDYYAQGFTVNTGSVVPGNTEHVFIAIAA